MTSYFGKNSEHICVRGHPSIFCSANKTHRGELRAAAHLSPLVPRWQEMS